MYLFRHFHLSAIFFAYGTSVPIKNAGELFGILEKRKGLVGGSRRWRFQTVTCTLIGRNSSSGGGFDNRILEVIEQIPVGNRALEGNMMVT